MTDKRKPVAALDAIRADDPAKPAIEQMRDPWAALEGLVGSVRVGNLVIPIQFRRDGVFVSFTIPWSVAPTVQPVKE